MATTSIVRIGPSDNNLSATLLRTALVSYFDSQNNDTNNNNNNSSSGDRIETESRISIQNKYFTANVLLEDIPGGDSSSSRSSSTTTTTEKEDGVILIFDTLLSNPDRPTITSNQGGSAAVAATGSATTFDALAAAHERAETQNTCGDLLRLCVGVTLGEFSPEEIRGQNCEKEYSRRILWCLDHGYEYIEADISKEGQQKGHGDRDKEGFARVVEAIQGTVWSSAVMSTAKTKELKESYVDDKTAIQDDEKEGKEGYEENEENPYQPPDPSLLLQSRSKPAEDTAKAIGELEAASMVLDPNEVGAPEMAALRKDLEAEKLFDKMESVLREASQIREASKSGALSDDERRERAGDAALALVNLMGQFGIEDDDSEGYDSEDSGGA